MRIQMFNIPQYKIAEYKHTVLHNFIRITKIKRNFHIIMKKKRRYHGRRKLKPYLSQTNKHVFYEKLKNNDEKQEKLPIKNVKVLALPIDLAFDNAPKPLQISIKPNKEKTDKLAKIKNKEYKNINKQQKITKKRTKRRLLLTGRDLYRKRKLRRNRTRVGRKLRNKSIKKQGIISARLRYYPIAMHGLFLQNRRILFLPPSRKTFHLLKIVLKSFVPLLHSAIKKQIYWFSTLRQLLSRLFTLPGFIPKLALVRKINLIILKELSNNQNKSSYFRKLYKSRWILFQGAFSALSASINSFDRTRKIGISFIGMYVRNVTAALVCNYIVHKLGQYFTIQETLRPVIFDLRKSPRLSGFKIVVAGRLTRKERAAFLIRKHGKLTRSTNDANIDYSYDFKIMRFGVVGVKVWFQIKKHKPCFYKFSFLLLCIAFSTLTLRERVARQKNWITMQKRGMLTRASGSNTAFKVTSGLTSSALTRHEKKDMSRYLRGNWDPESRFGKQTTSKDGITHDTIVDLRLLKYPGLQQLNNALTSNPNCHKHVESIIAVSLHADRLFDGSKMQKKEHVAWHRDYFTYEDVKRSYIPKTPSTRENDWNLDQTLLFIQAPIFIRQGYGAKLLFVTPIPNLPDMAFQTNTTYQEGMFLAEMLKRRQIFGVDIPTKPIVVDQKPLAIAAPPKLLEIAAPPKRVIIPISLQSVIHLPAKLPSPVPLFSINQEIMLEIMVMYLPENNTPSHFEITGSNDSISQYLARRSSYITQQKTEKELKDSQVDFYDQD